MNKQTTQKCSTETYKITLQETGQEVKKVVKKIAACGATDIIFKCKKNYTRKTQQAQEVNT